LSLLQSDCLLVPQHDLPARVSDYIRVYIMLLFIQDRVGSSEALQAAEEQLSQATQAAQSLSAELESSQGESRRLRQEFEQQIEMLTQQLRDQVKETDDALQNALAAEKAKDKVRVQHTDAICGNLENHHGVHAFDCLCTVYYSLSCTLMPLWQQ